MRLEGKATIVTGGGMGSAVPPANCMPENGQVSAAGGDGLCSTTTPNPNNSGWPLNN